MSSDEDRPQKRRRTRGTEQGKYMAELFWKQHWSGGDVDEAIELVTDSAGSVRALFTAVLETLTKHESSSALLALFGKKILKPATANSSRQEDPPIIQDFAGGFWEVTAHRRSDFKVFMDALVANNRCPRLLQVIENGKNLMDFAKCTCSEKEEFDDPARKSINIEHEIDISVKASEEASADYELDTDHVSGGSERDNTEECCKLSQVRRPQNTPAVPKKRRGRPAKNKPYCPEKLKSLQTDLEAVKKSVDAMWNSKIESQKLKIDSLTETLRISESNLEHFRSNWIKEKEQNEELWKRVHILQQLFCQLRRSAVNSLHCKASTLKF